jgi:hypothetical protein
MIDYFVIRDDKSVVKGVSPSLDNIPSRSAKIPRNAIRDTVVKLTLKNYVAQIVDDCVAIYRCVEFESVLVCSCFHASVIVLNVVRVPESVFLFRWVSEIFILHN